MSNFRNKELRYFRCPHCEKKFYIKHNETNSQWRRFMPPRFCPGCGHKIEGE